MVSPSLRRKLLNNTIIKQNFGNTDSPFYQNEAACETLGWFLDSVESKITFCRLDSSKLPEYPLDDGEIYRLKQLDPRQIKYALDAADSSLLRRQIAKRKQDPDYKANLRENLHL